MPIVCGVKFRGGGKVYFFDPADVQDIQCGDFVIVDTARGQELAEITMPSQEVDDSSVVGQLKPLVSRASATDLLDAAKYREMEPEAVEKCKEQVSKYKLPMKIVGAEYSYDGTRLTLFFSSEQRVDFRVLVRELARMFRTRIELRQIGVRDEAKIIGGVGRCGRPLCCATWLNEFCPVSIKMAKQQELPLSPMEISGLCGRLLCCLNYENEFYREIKGRFPKVGKIIDSPRGPAKVIKVNALTEKVTLLLEDGDTLELTADQLSGKEPIDDAAVTEETPSARRMRTTSGVVGGSMRSEPEMDGDEEPAPRSRAPSPAPQRPRRPQTERPAAPAPVETPPAAPAEGEAATKSSRRRRSRRGRSGRPADGQKPADGAKPQGGQPAQADAQAPTNRPDGQNAGAQSGEQASTHRPRRRRSPRHRTQDAAPTGSDGGSEA
ncbi:MAG: PSP1 domain-containing protein [Anaerolineae bacterium]